MSDQTPHPFASQPPSPSRGEGKRERVADTAAGVGSQTVQDARVWHKLSKPRSQPSPLEGEGGPATPGPGEGSSTVVKRARPEWRQTKTRRLRPFAKRMRSAPTDAEAKMWALLRSRRLADFKFRRQVPVGRYIADFLCPAKKLIVELDGSQHAESATDAERDSWLGEQGFCVLRIWNFDLFERPDSVCEAIWTAVMEVKR